MTDNKESAIGASQPEVEPNRFLIDDRINAAYYGELGEAFARQTRERVHWVASNSVGDRILDVGCSQGIGCILLGREGCEVTGVDISPEAIDIANRYLAVEAETVRERVTFVSADFMAYDFGNRQFSTVVLGEVLEHLTRPAEFVARAFELLEPGGRLVVTVPFGINDFPDHKRTYYLTGIPSLLDGLFKLREARYFGPWIGFCADRLAERTEPGALSFLLTEVEGLENSFLVYERKLRDASAKVSQELFNANQRIKTILEQSSAHLARAQSAEQKFAEANRQAIDNGNAAKGAEKAIADVRREADLLHKQAQSELATARAEAARLGSELARANEALALARAEADSLRLAQADLATARTDAVRLGSDLARANEALAQRIVQTTALEKQVKEKAAKASQTEQRVKDLERERSLILDSTSMKAGRLLVESAGSPAALMRMPRRLWGVYREAKSRRSATGVQNSAENDGRPRQPGTPAAERPVFPRSTVLPICGQAGNASGLVSTDRLALPQRRLIPGQETMPVDVALARSAGTVELVLDRASGSQEAFMLTVTHLTDKRRFKTAAARSSTVSIPSGSDPQVVVAFPVERDTQALRVTFSAGSAPVELCPDLGVTFFPRGVSVIIPAFKSVDRIDNCLSTLVAQTLDRDAFEAIVVLNGPEDGAEAVVAAFIRAHPDLNIRVLRTSPASAGHARNVGISAARFDHITLLDDDDMLTPDYLAAMLAEADGDRVVIASIRDVLDNELHSTPLSTQIETAAGRSSVPFSHLNSLYSMNACKLVPCSAMRRFAFDPGLRSGEDVAFWAQLATTMLPGNQLIRDHERAFYLRTLTAESVSRRASSYGFLVSERIAVIAKLAQLRASADCRSPGFVDGQMRSQAGFIHRYLKENPQDYPRATSEMVASGLPAWVLTEMNAALADELVLSFCFPPSNDTAGIVAAKRMAMGRMPADAISNRMVSVRQSDPSLSRLTLTRLGRHIETEAPEAFSNWNAIEAFCKQTREAIDKMVEWRGRPYSTLYSRAMWPSSHFAAAYQKARQPDLAWLAEFSDPLLHDVKGVERGGSLDSKWLNRSGLRDLVAARGFGHITHDKLFAWCEILPITLADKLIFTNQNQLDYMLDYQSDQRLREMMRAKAKIVPQPTLPHDYYELVEPRYQVDPQVINIAYFGTFYQTRGVGELFTALGLLREAERARLCLHIFTQNPTEVARMAEAMALEDSIRVQGYINYLEFLSTSTLFDYLYVNDAKCADQHRLNPYLPSKLSDYLGTGCKILASIEAGSSMSRISLPEGSIAVPLDDQLAMIAALRLILERRTT